MHILVATKNPAKLEGVKKALDGMFVDVTVTGVDAPSEVKDVPVGWREVIEGADNRL